MNAPMFIPFISLGIGILTAPLGFNTYVGTLFIIIGALAYLYIISFKNNPVKFYNLSQLHHIWIAFCFIGAGIILGNTSLPSHPSSSEIKKAVAGKGKILNIANSTNGDKLTLEIYSLYNKEGGKTDYNNLKVICYSDAVNVNIGDIILFPANNLNPITDSENSFLSGYSSSMASKGFFYNLHVNGINIKKIDSQHDIFSLSERIRDKIVEFIEKKPLKKDTKYFIITVLTGDRGYLDSDTRQIFSDAGMAHTLALSGMHVGIISGILLFILFPLNFFGKYKVRLVLTALLLWFYAFITGLSPSIVRACIMISTFMLALILERKNTSLNSLFLAGFLILLFMPRSIYDIGFQLSFLCVGSLILFTGKLNPISLKNHPKLHYFCGLILASLIATFSSWIIVAFYFHSFPTMFLAANVIILPFLPFYISFILIYLFLEGLGLHSPFLTALVDRIYDTMISFLDQLGQHSTLSLIVPKTAVIIWCIGLVVLALYFYNKKINKVASLAVASLCFFSSLLSIFLIAATPEKGVIICNTYPNLNLKIRNDNKETVYNPPVNSISLNSIGNKSFLIVDYKDLSHIKAKFNKETGKNNIYQNISNPDYLIVTGRYKGTIEELYHLYRPKLLVFHPSIRKKREEELIQEAKALAAPFHSIRNDRALKIPFN